jgi:hypothetical protein
MQRALETAVAVTSSDARLDFSCLLIDEPCRRLRKVGDLLAV